LYFFETRSIKNKTKEREMPQNITAILLYGSDNSSDLTKEMDR
jgi:hypothetical protein